VCLSLLGTWAGSSVESWDPAKSNILQVFYFLFFLGHLGLEALKLGSRIVYRSACFLFFIFIFSLGHRSEVGSRIVYRSPGSLEGEEESGQEGERVRGREGERVRGREGERERWKEGEGERETRTA